MKRISAILLTLLIGISSVACSSRTAMNAGCDFVTTAHDKTKQDERGYSSGESHIVETSILTAIIGIFVREANDNDECMEPAQYVAHTD
ncbi:hypothetical protein [Shewanella sp. 10N.286.54.B9]|uniref:hypothetical protein n=1 Tax=Shewanella sp. 10N.286.54.B9 TaxID=3229719 RepID=UPI00354E77E2